MENGPSRNIQVMLEQKSEACEQQTRIKRLHVKANSVLSIAHNYKAYLIFVVFSRSETFVTPSP